MNRIVPTLLAISPLTLIAALAFGFSPFRDVIAADWPSFRGADRSAVSQETGLLDQWPEDGPPLVWQAEGAGRGYASVAIAGDHVFTLGDGVSTADDDDEYLLCFDRKDGRQIWKTKTGPAWTSGQVNWQSSRSTPTVDGNLVYALTAQGELVCCDVATGKEKWRKNLKTDFGGKKADGWGYSESVLVDGDRLICTPGGTTTTMAALNKRTGKVIWKMVRDDDRGAAHASCVISEVGDTRVYVQSTGSGPLGVRASDGKLLWSYPIERTTAIAPTPIIRGDLVFFSAGYKRGGALLRQKADNKGGVSIEEVYPLNPQLANKHGGIVLVGDYLFGDSDDAGIPFCAELATGEIVWKKRGSGRGSAAMAAADGKLYIHFADGTMVLAEAKPDGFTEVGSFKVPGSGERPSWAHPAIVDGKLYLRENGVVLCYDVRDQKAEAAGGR